MKFPKLCDIRIEHEYYNARTSERLVMQMVPSVESAKLIKNKHIVIRKNNNVFSIYGDVFNIEEKFETEFKLSFALSISDPRFFDASNLKRPEEIDSGSTQTALRQGNSKTVFYFHNARTDPINSKAYLSKTEYVDQDDLVLLYPLAFTMEGLEEISAVKLSKPDIDVTDETRKKLYRYYVVVDPKDETKVNRIFNVDLAPFGSGRYTFDYKEMSHPAVFYLNDEFYGSRPFAVIEIFFNDNIASVYKPLPEDKKPPKIFYLSIPARSCKWRYRIISKFKKYKDLEIGSEPPNHTFAVSDESNPDNGEIIFESENPLSLRQVLNSSLELRGTYVETLGMDHFKDEKDDDEEDPPVKGKICRLPNPTIENLVFGKLKKQMKYYCDMFVYI